MSARVTTLEEDVKRKLTAKLDQDRVLYALIWIEEILGSPFEVDDLHSALKSGVKLCQLANHILPGSVARISTQEIAFKQRDNISSYLRFCRRLGMPQSDLFEPDDLFEAKDLVCVLNNLYSLGGHCQLLPDWKGPVRGPARRPGVSSDDDQASAESPRSQAFPETGFQPPDSPRNDNSGRNQQHNRSISTVSSNFSVSSHQSAKRGGHHRSETSLFMRSPATGPLVIDAPSLDEDVKRKLKDKVDPYAAMQALLWLEALCNEEFETDDLHLALRSGARLCKAVNSIVPGSVRKINPPGVAFRELENITQFLLACKRLGMPELDLFDTQDLHDGGNIPSVLDTIYALGGIAQNLPEFPGPHIGPRRRNTLLNSQDLEAIQDELADVNLSSSASPSSPQPHAHQHGNHHQQEHVQQVETPASPEPREVAAGGDDESCLKLAFCPGCGFKLPEGGCRFCSECGHRLQR